MLWINISLDSDYGGVVLTVHINTQPDTACTTTIVPVNHLSFLFFNMTIETHKGTVVGERMVVIIVMHYDTGWHGN